MPEDESIGPVLPDMETAKPQDVPPVSFFTKDELAARTEGDITTFPAGTRGLVEIVMLDPTIDDVENVDETKLPGGTKSITVKLGVAQTEEDLRAVSGQTYLRTQPYDYADLFGYKIGTSSTPEASPDAQALGPDATPQRVLEKLFDDPDALQRALRTGINEAVIARGFGKNPALLSINPNHIKDAYFLIRGPKLADPANRGKPVPPHHA